MDINKERKAFEDWFSQEFRCDEWEYNPFSHIEFNDIDAYSCSTVNASWKAWQAAKAQAVPECKWTQNEDGYFDASCGQSFVFSEPEDKPSKHKFTHCCFCGGKLVEAQEPAND